MLDRVLVAMVDYHGCLNSGGWVPGLGRMWWTWVIAMGETDGTG